MSYPPAHRLDLVDHLHGHDVPDPYRWLEDPDTDQTRVWLAAQDGLARGYLDTLPGRDLLARRLDALLRVGVVGVPRLRGDRAFYLRRAGDQEHAVLVVREGGGAERVLIDPATLSADDTVTLDGYVASVEGDRLAYWLSEGGDEEASLYVMDVASGETVEGPIDRTRYCPLAWLPGGASFYYGRRLAPEQAPEGEDRYHRRIWFHRIGANPDDDELVFGDGRDKTEYHGVDVSRDGRWLVISASQGTAPRNDLYLADLQVGHHELRTVQEGVDAQTDCGVEDDGRLYVFTNLDAPRYRLAVADPAQPGPEHWTDLVAESEAVLEQFVLTADAVVMAATLHAVGQVTVHDRVTGAVREQVELPGLGSVGLSARPEGGDDVWIGYTDFVTPSQVHHYHVGNRTLTPWATAPGEPPAAGGGQDGQDRQHDGQIGARQETYTSADGTEVRMFVLEQPGSADQGPRPVILYGYGGFNIPLGPAYTAFARAWVEQGGVYVIANLRGGSEEGEAWHRAGMREHKQNVFDDFHAAAEHLVSRGITTHDHLGIYGGSNGGLLVGAAMTQRPELFAAVVCSAPLLDMVRYEQFGMGETWNDEFGTADDPTELGWLLGYSPYHRVVQGAEYPATLFTVFDSDTRVDPMHARKMAAALQWATASDRPVLLRREVDVGHGARSVARTVALSTDILAFLAARLGLKLPTESAHLNGERPVNEQLPARQDPAPPGVPGRGVAGQEATGQVDPDQD